MEPVRHLHALALLACCSTSASAQLGSQTVPAPASAPQPTPAPTTADPAVRPDSEALVDRVLAEAVPAEVAQAYYAAVDEAVDEFDRGNYRNARDAFRRAHELFPNARALRGVAKAEFELGNYRACIEAVEAALEHPVLPLDEELELDARRLMVQASAFVGRYRVVLQPPDAQVMLDGKPLPQDGSGEIVIEVGNHVLEVRSNGFVSQRLVLRATPGTNETLQVALEPRVPSPKVLPSAAQPLPPEATAAARSSDGNDGRSLGPYLVMAGAGTLLVGALVTGLIASSAEDDLDRHCGTDNVCGPDYADYQDTLDRGQTMQIASNVLLVLGSAAAVGGVGWWLLAPEQDDTNTAASLTCASSGCIARLQGRF